MQITKFNLLFTQFSVRVAQDCNTENKNENGVGRERQRKGGQERTRKKTAMKENMKK